MESFTFRPRGVCSSLMTIEHDNHVITNVTIVNGCRGNTQGVAKLLVGMTLEVLFLSKILNTFFQLYTVFSGSDKLKEQLPGTASDVYVILDISTGSASSFVGGVEDKDKRGST